MNVSSVGVFLHGTNRLMIICIASEHSTECSLKMKKESHDDEHRQLHHVNTLSFFSSVFDDDVIRFNDE